MTYPIPVFLGFFLAKIGLMDNKNTATGETMTTSLIQKLYEDLKNRGEYTIPPALLPPEKGYILIKWVYELFIHYESHGIVARALDDLSPIKLSSQPGINLSLQDIHKFIISDLNLIPLEGKKRIIENAIHYASSAEAWQHMVPLLLSQLNSLNRETVQEDLSWKFSPVGEMLWVITWFFMERESIQPPKPTQLICQRFPYYLWVTAAEGAGPVQQSLWEPDHPLCRWEWLASDLFYNWLQTQK